MELGSEPRIRILDGNMTKIEVLLKFLHEIAENFEAGDSIYVVGGAVRNYLLGVDVKDIDLVIDAPAATALVGYYVDSAWFAQKIVECAYVYDGVEITVATNNYGVAICTVASDWEVEGHNLKGEVIEIANARTESYTAGGYKPTEVAIAGIEADILRRDFTVNTLMWRLGDLDRGMRFAGIIDLTGKGLKDLYAKSLQCPQDPDVTFSDDPSRMIRAAKFMGKYQLRMTNETYESITNNAQLLKNIPAAHLSNMLINDFFETGLGGCALREMSWMGLLSVIQEIAAADAPFTEAINNWMDSKATIEFMLDMRDRELPFGKCTTFLKDEQADKLWQMVRFADIDGREFIAALRQPGRIIGFPALMHEFGLSGPATQVLTYAARECLLANPAVMNDIGLWEDNIRCLMITA